MTQRCEECGKRFNRPSFYSACQQQHSKPTLAQRIVEDVEKNLTGRRGLRWDGIDDECQDEIRDTLAKLVDERLWIARAMYDVVERVDFYGVALLAKEYDKNSIVVRELVGDAGRITRAAKEHGVVE